MSALDPRRPALVTEAFRSKIARTLAPLGFEPRDQGKALVRRKGKNVHRVTFQSSHRNAPGHAVAWPALVFEDAAARKLVKGWQAGGVLNGPAFALDVPTNVADADGAEALAAVIEARVAFFDWLEAPSSVLRDVSCRYVAGLVDPILIVPYLRAHLGEAAVLTYAEGLLGGRAELVPAYLTALGDSDERDARIRDHGTQLARAARETLAHLHPVLPTDVVPSPDHAARHLRCFFGRQLRAWGEPEAAGALRRVGDDDLLRVHAAAKASEEPLVDSAEAVRRLLALAMDVDRPPRRSSPEPRLFQYFARHTEPFSDPIPRTPEVSTSPR